MFSRPLPGKGQEPIPGHVYFGEVHFGGSVVKNLSASAGDAVRFLGWEDPLEKEIATHSSTLA